MPIYTILSIAGKALLALLKWLAGVYVPGETLPGGTPMLPSNLPRPTTVQAAAKGVALQTENKILRAGDALDTADDAKDVQSQIEVNDETGDPVDLAPSKFSGR